MEWDSTWEDPLKSYLKPFHGLIGDKRTWKTFGEAVKGIIGAGSLICQRIAAQSAESSRGNKGSQRVIRLATQAMLSSYATEHQGLPPRIAALLQGWQPPGEL